MIVRSCCNANDICLVKNVYRLLVSVYFQFRQYDNAILALHKLRDIAVDNDDLQSLIEIYQMIAQCHIKEGRNTFALSFYQTMLQYAWLKADVAAEIRAYNNLAVTYFNLADLKNSKYYHERGLNMIIEPEDSRPRKLACSELLYNQKEREQDRIIQYYHTPSVDCKGRPVQRIVRTTTAYDPNGGPIISTIEKYKNSLELRKVTERFIALKIAKDLENYETKEREDYPELFKDLMA